MPIQRAFIPYLSQAVTAETGLMKRPVSQNSLSENRGEGLQKWKTGKRGKILVRGDETLQTASYPLLNQTFAIPRDTVRKMSVT